jgi:hypothetical protein
VALLLILAKIVLSNLDKVLAKLRRKRLWMTVSLVRSFSTDPLSARRN